MRFLHRISLQNPISVSSSNPIEDENMRFKFVDNETLPLNELTQTRSINLSAYPDYKCFYFKRFQHRTVEIDLSALSPIDGDTYFLQLDRGVGTPQNYTLIDNNHSLILGSSQSTLSLEFFYSPQHNHRDLLVTLVYSQPNNCWVHFVESNHKGEFNIYPGYHWTNPGGGN